MKTTAREIEEKIFKKEREQKDLQARLDYIYFNYGKENFNDDELDDFGGDYQYAIETLSGEIETLKNEILELRNELEDDEDEKAEAPIENNLTVKVLAVKGFDRLMLNGKRISREDADDEVRNAMLRRRNYSSNAVLYTDTNVRNVLGSYFIYNGMCEWETKGAFKVADFGRDEIPYVNEKVDAIIAEYRAKAKAEDEEKARREAYEASDEGRLEEIQLKISCAESEIRDGKRFIEYKQKQILKYQGYIVDEENEIIERGLEVANFESELEKYAAEKVKIENSIRNKAINAAAAEIEDDCSNDDEDDETAVDAFVEVEDDDDELADDLIIIKSEKAEFELDRFGEDYDKSAAEIRMEIDDIRKQLEILQDRLYAKEEELESKTAEVTDWANKAIGSVEKNYSIYVNDHFGQRYKVRNSDEIYCHTSLDFKRNAEDFVIASPFFCNLARYGTAKEFVKAVAGLVNAMNRCDAEYTFPAA